MRRRRCSVTDDVTWCCFPTKGLRELTSDPFSRWVCSNCETQDLAATVLQYQQSIEQSEGDGRNHEQVHRRDAVSMIMQERPPALGWRPPTLWHVFGDRGSPDIDAELKEFTVNAWCAPERISDTHVADEPSGSHVESLAGHRAVVISSANRLGNRRGANGSPSSGLRIFSASSTRGARQ